RPTIARPRNRAELRTSHTARPKSRRLRRHSAAARGTITASRPCLSGENAVRCPFRSSTVAALLLAAAASRLVAGVGDPQVRTDHSWYPGELACSTFERLQATQADLYA